MSSGSSGSRSRPKSSGAPARRSLVLSESKDERGGQASERAARRARRLGTLAPGTRGTVIGVELLDRERAARLAALGVTTGATVTLLQRFPAVVFVCDQTELAVEPAVARMVLVDVSAEGTVVHLAEESAKSPDRLQAPGSGLQEEPSTKAGARGPEPGT